MKWIECNDCAEEFRVICDSGTLVNFCPFCGSEILHSEDDHEENEDLEW